MIAPGSWRRASTWLALALVLGFGYRAVTGVVGGFAYPRAKFLIDEGEYERAIELLDVADVGFERYAVLHMRGNVRAELWRALSRRADPPEDVDAMLREASRDFMAAAAANPSSAQPFRGLARIYHWVELDRRAAVETPPGWGSIGRHGRIAIGLARKSAERSPNEYEHWDDLATILLGYGLHEPALEAVREAARVQPAFNFHSFAFLRDLPREVRETFAVASRESLDNAPLLVRRVHLVSLGKLEFRLGNIRQAERDFLAALDEPGNLRDRSEGHYWLGLTQIELGRDDEARRHLQAAAEHPGFELSSLVGLADIALRAERLDEAFTLLAQVRRLAPRNLTHCLRFAAVAHRLENYPAAVEALRWAIVTHPSSVRAHAALVEVYLDSGRTGSARTTLAEARRRFGDVPELRELRAAIDQGRRKKDE